MSKADAIAAIELGPVAPLSELNAGFLRNRALFCVNPNQRDLHATQHRIKIASTTVAEPSNQHKIRVDG